MEMLQKMKKNLTSCYHKTIAIYTEMLCAASSKFQVAIMQLAIVNPLLSLWQNELSCFELDAVV